MNDTAVGKGWCEGRTDIYGTHIHYSWTTAGYARHRRKNPDLEPLDGAAGYTTNSHHSVTGEQHLWIHVHVKGHDSLAAVFQTIAHEAYHATEALFKHIEDEPKGEPPAYFCGWLSSWLYVNIPKAELARFEK